MIQFWKHILERPDYQVLVQEENENFSINCFSISIQLSIDNLIEKTKAAVTEELKFEYRIQSITNVPFSFFPLSVFSCKAQWKWFLKRIFFSKKVLFSIHIFMKKSYQQLQKKTSLEIEIVRKPMEVFFALPVCRDSNAWNKPSFISSFIRITLYKCKNFD